MIVYAPHVQDRRAYTMNETEIRNACERTIGGILQAPFEFRHDSKTSCATDYVYRLKGLRADLCIGVDVRCRMRPADVPLFEAMGHDGGCAVRMFFSEYVTDSVGVRLRERGFWYADAQGNAFLEVPGEVLVRVAGKGPKRPPTPKGQHFSVSGAKVLHDLLRRGPRIGATYRKIRETTGVSIDKIGKVIRELERDGTVQGHGAGDVEILDGGRLLRLWDEAYEARLAPALDLGRYRDPTSDFDLLVERAVEVLGHLIVVGGEVAGDVYTGHLRPGRLRLYVPGNRADALRRKLRLAPSEDGLVELCELYSPEIGGSRMFREARVAGTAFTYAELMAEDDDRLAETAMRLRKEYLAWTL